MTGLFITGTDTGVGKTRVAVAMIRSLRAQGLNVAAMKPVSAGSAPRGDSDPLRPEARDESYAPDELNEDVVALLQASNVATKLSDMNPYAFAEPVAPHIAAQQAGVRIDLDVIAAAYSRLAAQADVVVVEGAGGFLVPLNGDVGIDVIPASLRLPVVMVVGLRLGCLNHALLTAEAVRMMRLLFLGFGTVGQGLAELLLAKRDELARRFGFDWQVTGIADTLKGSVVDPAGIDLARALEAARRGESLARLGREGGAWDGLTMVRHAEADVLLEATYTDIKTGEPATSHVRAALERGLHVVTSNKGPLALHYRELAELASRHGVQFRFEGTVMSGTPLLNLIREAMAGAEVLEVQGILNGTTNFILTEMEKGLAYDAALKRAQELGYAEAVPDADVLGWDALAKVTILANVVFGASLKPSDSPCQGITEISSGDIARAAADGESYKLIGRVWRDADGVHASVAPQRLPGTHPLAGVGGATNAMTITTDALGEVTIIGPGAGRRQTGFALLNDLLTMWRHS